MDPFAGVLRALHAAQVRFVMIGLAGVNCYARSGGMLFATQDTDLFVPLDPDNLLCAWEACSGAGLSLWAGDEPLDRPRDLQLARTVVERRAATSATDERGLEVDFTLIMAGFEFEDVWSRMRTFLVEGVEVPVARLTDIVRSKANAGRPKDRLFLATHEDALKQFLHAEEEGGGH